MAETVKIQVNSLPSLMDAFKRLKALFDEHKYLVLSIRIGRDRTLSQNALWFAMYKRASDVGTQGSPEDVRRYCKLTFGVPIMLRDEGFSAAWDRYFASEPYSYQLRLMGANSFLGPHGFPVTSLFDRAQGIEYTEAMVAHYAKQAVFFDDLLQGEA